MELAGGKLMENETEQVALMVLVGVKQMKETRNKYNENGASLRETNGRDKEQVK
jgi:hypothetical protein